MDAEWNIIYDKLQRCADSGAKVVLSRLAIGDLGTQFFADRDIFCAGRVSLFPPAYLSWLSLFLLLFQLEVQKWISAECLRQCPHDKRAGTESDLQDSQNRKLSWGLGRGAGSSASSSWAVPCVLLFQPGCPVGRQRRRT